jgi:predicted ABC-type ATPase/DNA-binding MarR family transcriptional regulator
MINKQYRQKLEAVADARKNKKWSSYINLHERPYRLDAFMDVEDEMTDGEYWSSLADVWVDSENIWQNQDIWKSALSSKRPDRISMMNKEEQKEFASLPNELTIYRGYLKGKNKNGLSWTTDRDKAEWFSNRLAGRGDNPVVQQATVNKKDVVAYFSRRGESEVVVAKTPKITGSMNVGPSEELISRREEREIKVGKASDALDRILAENPTKYKNLKKSAVSVYNAVTTQNVKEQNIIDTPEEAVDGIPPIKRAGDILQRDFTVNRRIKQHLAIKRIMAELMSDFSVDKDGNLKGKPSEHISDEKNIARRKFSNSLSDAAKKVIADKKLFFEKGKPAGRASQMVQEKDKAKREKAVNEIDELVQKMTNEGKGLTEIANSLGVSKQAIAQRLKKLGVYEPNKAKKAIEKMRAEIVEFSEKNPTLSKRRIAEELGYTKSQVHAALRGVSRSIKSGPEKGTPWSERRRESSGVTGAMGMFDKLTNSNPDEPGNNPRPVKPFTPINLPKMDDSVSRRIGFKGKLTTYDPQNYTKSYPQRTIDAFIARGDEPSVSLDATFGGTTKIKEDRFWDLYQPLAVALSKSVKTKRKDGEQKRFISVGGSPGSGKSTLRFSNKHNIPLPDSAVHIDADEMKTLIPEAVEMHRNGNPNWGDASHEESRIMADVALKVGLENDHDVVYDSTGQFNSGFGTLKAARAKGYDIVMHYNVAPDDVLGARIDEREKKDPRRLPRHIIPAVNRRNFDIMPKVAKSSDEFYLWDTDVPDGTEPVLLARKLKGGELEILDAKAYAYGDFDPNMQGVDFSKPDYKVNPRKVAKDSIQGDIITAYNNGKSVAEISNDTNYFESSIYQTIIGNEIDENIRPSVTYRPGEGTASQPSLFPESRPRKSESLSDNEAMNQFRSLSSADKAILKDFIAKKPGVSLDQMTDRAPMDLVIWASAQKPEHIQPMGQIRSIEKLESLSPSKRQQLTEMLQGGESVIDIANALNIPFAVIDVAMDFVDQYGYIPEAGDTEEKSVLFGMVSGNRISRLIGKTIKASILNGVVINER